MHPRVELLQARRLLAVTFDPSAQEQEMLEWVNRMRTDPQAHLYDLVDSTSPLHSSDPDIQSALTYFHVSGTTLLSQWSALTPVAPLAWNASLWTSARTHSQLMITDDQQAHQLPGEDTLSGRAQSAGYTNWSNLGENIFAYADSVVYGHAGFAIDWGNTSTGIQSPPGHRQNIMSANFVEVGIGILSDANPATGVGPLVITEDFGARWGISGSWLVGVVYDDTNSSGRYTAGEGLGGVSVRIAGSGVDQTITTMSAGGYQTLLQPGAYTVTFYGGGLASPVTRGITVGAQNAKLDYVVATPLTVNGTSGADTISVTASGDNIAVTVNGTTTTRQDVRVSAITINGLAGNDTIMVGAGVMPVTIYGGYGNDQITGGDGGDLIYGEGGNDVINGGLGNDTVLGNTENDQITGGDGDDQVQGGLGADTLNGSAGNDSIYGGDNTDLIHGDAGNDYIEGKGKADTIHGDDGNDTIYGNAGSDQVFGEAGEDWLYGQDTLVFKDSLDGGIGTDRYTADSNDVLTSVEVNLLA